jgi:hypothetical protein
MRALVTQVLVTLAVCAAHAAAQTPAQPTPPPAQPPPSTQTPAPPGTPPAAGQPAPVTPAVPVGRILTGDAGLIFFPVKPERVADFEKIMAKLKDALATSEDETRRQQAAGWKVFKAVEPGPNNTALYVFLIDPNVKGTDYAFWKLLYDSFPTEVQELYRLYNAASAGNQTMLNLQLLQEFKSPD